VVFLTDDELKYRQAFIDAGWKTFSIQDVLDNPDKYTNLKENKGE
jgi:hypothetical protein